MASLHYAVDIGLIKQGMFETKAGPGQPRLADGNQLIAFERERQEVYFLGTSEVESVEEVRSEEEIRRLVAVRELSPFPERRLLSVFAGSLKKVYRFLEPERHFWRKVVALSASDFETLHSGRVDIYRTVFRYLFSALPFEVRAAFVREYGASVSSSVGTRVSDYRGLAEAVVSFFDERVRETMRLLAQLATVHQDIRVSELPPVQMLHVASESNAEVIALGDTATDAKRELHRNLLFTGKGEVAALLQEASKQLVVGEDAKLWMRWDETLL